MVRVAQRTCSASLVAVLEAQRDYSFVVNGRFKGGYITRHYGKPDAGVDAIQLELAQLNYMNEDTFAYDEKSAHAVAEGHPPHCWRPISR